MSLQGEQHSKQEYSTLLLTFFLSLSILVVTGFIFGLAGLWTPIFLKICFCVFLISILGIISIWSKEILFSLKNETVFHVFVLSIFTFTIFLHGLNVFTPETGFDALWYHLPIIQNYVDDTSLNYQRLRYQSLYPQYGDIFLLFGYSALGVPGAKLVAYGFFILLIYLVYSWFRKSLSIGDSILGTLVVCYFQVVAWQASSAYVDIISAVFFLFSIFYIVEYFRNKSVHSSTFLLSALSAGLFFGTKFINLGFIPLFFVVLMIFFFTQNQHHSLLKIQKISIWLAIAFIVALPWYFRSWWYTGNILYPMGTIYAVPVIQQMGVSGWSEWLSFRFFTMWRLPFEFLFRNDGYVTPLLLFAPILFIRRKFTIEQLLLLSVGIYGLLFWFFFPPPSTRYVLGPIIVLWIIVYQQMLSIHSERFKDMARYVVLLSVVPFLLIRVFVTTRSLPYIMGYETQHEYLNRFRNGFLDEKIDSFYYDYQRSDD